MADTPTHVKSGDRVRDPWDGRWRAVTEVTDEGVMLADGGVMSPAECTEVILPGEPTPEPGSTDDVAAADRQHAAAAPPREAGVHI